MQKDKFGKIIYKTKMADLESNWKLEMSAAGMTAAEQDAKLADWAMKDAEKAAAEDAFTTHLQRAYYARINDSAEPAACDCEQCRRQRRPMEET